MQPYFRQTALTVDTSHAHKLYEEEANILDDSVLDHSALDSGLDMSPPTHDSRRESFAAYFSPKQEDWTVEMQSIPSNNPFDSQSTSTFMRMDAPQAHAFSHGGAGWAVGGSMAQEYDFSRPLQPPTHFNNPPSGAPLFTAAGAPGSIPASPHQKEWVTHAHAIPKKMQPGSPIRSHNDLRRGADGIRKKNARFEIPADRNLSNIDQLIAMSTDEQEVKELKQQKRLLRNRQAALDSRQRKKQHTERLEDEKKQFTALINEMEEEINELKAQQKRAQEYIEELQAQLQTQAQQAHETFQRMSHEKDELIERHTIESGDLRKKISILTDHVQRLENAAAMSGNAQASSNGYGSTFGEIDGLSMDGSWENMGFLNDFSMEHDIKPETAVVPVKKEVTLPGSDKSVPSYILPFIVLIGAWCCVRSLPTLPQVSDDVKSASATLLEQALRSTGSGLSSALPSMAEAASAPQPSGGNMWAEPATMSSSSTLGELSDELVQPTQDQMNQQLFGISAAEYGAASQDFTASDRASKTGSSAGAPAAGSTGATASQGRRNLAETLAAARASNTKHATAEVYTRSLLWDQIPPEVVRNFQKWVAECSPQNDEQHDT